MGKQLLRLLTSTQGKTEKPRSNTSSVGGVRSSNLRWMMSQIAANSGMLITLCGIRAFKRSLLRASETKSDTAGCLGLEGGNHLLMHELL
jgi:hypothetical protein